MRMKNFYRISLLLVIANSCMPYRTKMSNPENAGYRRLDVTDISFFENIRFDTTSKSKKTITLFFNRDNQLEFLETNVLRSKSHSRFYFFKKEESSMVVSKRLSVRYFDVDTIVFFNDKCYHKKVNYDTVLNSALKWAGMTSFSIYEYRSDNLLVSKNTFYLNDSIAAKKGIYEYIKNDQVGKVNNVSPYRIIESHIDKDISKKQFFTNYFTRL